MRHLLLIFLLVTVIITAGCVNQSGYSSYCGGVQYHYPEQNCCGSTIYTPEQRDAMHIGCCNGTMYNNTDHDCCGGKIIYGRDIDSCCYGVVIDNTTQGCCLSKVYDKATQHCCAQKVAPGGGSWDTFCGSQCYNMDTQSCCYGVVIDNTTHGCCINVVYDRTSQRCCDNKLESGTGDCPEQGGAGGGDSISICNSAGQGSAACFMSKQNEEQENSRLICPSCSH